MSKPGFFIYDIIIGSVSFILLSATIASSVAWLHTSSYKLMHQMNTLTNMVSMIEQQSIKPHRKACPIIKNLTIHKPVYLLVASKDAITMVYDVES